MSWSSSDVATDQDATAAQHNALRTDIRAGKVWDTAGLLWARNYHDGTNTILDSSSGDIHIKPAGGNVRLTNAAGTHYLNVAPASAATSLTTAAGRIDLRPFGNNTRICNAAGTRYLNIALGGADVVFTQSPTGYLNLGGIKAQEVSLQNAAATIYCTMKIVGNHTVFENYAEAGADFVVIPHTKKFILGNNQGRYYIVTYDTTLSKWQYVYVSNGVLVVSCP